MKWFYIFICVLVGLALGEKVVNYWNYYNDISITATTKDGHRCLTVFSPEPSMACYKLPKQQEREE